MTETPQFREELQGELPLPLQGVKGYMFKFGKDKNTVGECGAFPNLRADSESCISQLFVIHTPHLQTHRDRHNATSSVDGERAAAPRLPTHLTNLSNPRHSYTDSIQTESSLTWALLLFCTFYCLYFTPAQLVWSTHDFVAHVH